MEQIMGKYLQQIEAFSESSLKALTNCPMTFLHVLWNWEAHICLKVGWESTLDHTASH